MLTTLIDLFTTGTAIGLVSTLAAVGVAVLPWRATEAKSATDALDAAVRFPLAAGVAFASVQTPTPVAIRR